MCLYCNDQILFCDDSDRTIRSLQPHRRLFWQFPDRASNAEYRRQVSAGCRLFLLLIPGTSTRSAVPVTCHVRVFCPLSTFEASFAHTIRAAGLCLTLPLVLPSR